VAVLLGAVGVAAGGQQPAKDAPKAEGARAPHIVFLFSDHYSPHKTIPPVAKEWAKTYGLKVTFLGMDSNRTNMPGLEALAEADLMVMFMRWRALPDNQFKMILDYIEAGKPAVGLRTATHAIRYPKDNPLSKWNRQFGPQIFGQKWLRHGRYDRVEVARGQAEHPILKGVDVDKLDTGDLYHLLPLPKEIQPILIGKRKKVACPVAWTWAPKGGRVFYTSYGRRNDFKNPHFRRMLLNAMYWAMNRPLPQPKGG